MQSGSIRGSRTEAKLSFTKQKQRAAVKQETKHTIHYLSYIRAFACLAIVILHTVDAAVILYGDKLSQGTRAASLSVVYCMMWAVPCFVMVTGALLLNKNKTITIKDVFRKYILRILIALVAFSLLFALFDTLMNKDGQGAGFLLTGLKNALTGDGWGHMWYLYLLIGLYLLLIFYRAVAHHISEKEYKYLLLVYFIFLSVLPLFGMVQTKVGFYIHVSTIYPFYLFAGYALAEKKLQIKTPVSLVLILVGAAGIIGSAILEQAKAELVSAGNLLTYSSIFIVVLSLGAFSLIQNLGGRKQAEAASEEVEEAKAPGIFGKLLLALDGCSFGIYLIHMIFVRLILRYLRLNPFRSSASILIFAGLVIANLLLSWGITWLLKRIPGVRKIL